MKSICKSGIVFLCLAAAAFFAAAHKENRPYVQTEKENRQLQDLVIEQTGKEETENSCEKEIDFEALRQINPDICGWISIPGTAINYPVLIGESDEEYLKKDFKGEYSRLGSVFAFSDTAKDFSDVHNCFFAHNMKKPQMFGELKKYKNPQFAKEHSELYLYTPEGEERYLAFSAFECKKQDEIFAHKMERGSVEFEQLLANLIYRSMWGGEPEGLDGQWGKVLTLSTCSEYDRTNKRMTVHFVKIE